MARIRTIKPEFFTSLTVADLPVHARLTFIGLWTYVDDEGRGPCDARLVKAALWPLDDRTAADVEGDLTALTEASLIAQYVVDGRRYLLVTGFAEHQKINHPSRSKYPGPNAVDKSPTSAVTSRNEDSGMTPGVLPEDSLPERKGTGKGTGNREGNSSTTTVDTSPATQVETVVVGDLLEDLQQAVIEALPAARGAVALRNTCETLANRGWTPGPLYDTVRSANLANAGPGGIVEALRSFGRPPTERPPAEPCARDDCENGWLLGDGARDEPCPTCSPNLAAIRARRTA
jgi:hypothetical protein